MVGVGRLGGIRALGVMVALVAACAGRSIDKGGGEAGDAGSSGSRAAGATSGRGGAGGAVTGAGGGGGTGRPIVPPHEPSAAPCGNGQHDAAEECDDGNKLRLDGCTFACQVEVDWVCPEVGPCSADACGNGWLARYEECDDGNAFDGDGCSGGCVIEKGWECPGVGLPCRPSCGDLLVTGVEDCDDGNRESGDGCSRACHLEGCGSALPDIDVGAAGASGADAACVVGLCGDGFALASEDCDDGPEGNDGRYGGCNPDCSYAAYCGDGITNGSEECDTWPDFVEYGAGGCTRACRFSPYCGDGNIDAAQGETCDNAPYNGKGFCQANCLVSTR